MTSNTQESLEAALKNVKEVYKAAFSEKDPNGKNAKEGGAKLDAGKPDPWSGLFDYFPRACLAVADVSSRGAQKYSWKGWETVPDGERRYGAAMGRHILYESIEGLYDTGPGGLGKDVLHASQVAWNALARLELLIRRLDSERNKVDNVVKPVVPESSINFNGACYNPADWPIAAPIYRGGPVQQCSGVARDYTVKGTG